MISIDINLTLTSQALTFPLLAPLAIELPMGMKKDLSLKLFLTKTLNLHMDLTYLFKAQAQLILPFRKKLICLAKKPSLKLLLW